MGCEGTTKEYDQNFKRLVSANCERDARFYALGKENRKIDADLIDDVCAATDFKAIDNEDLIKICEFQQEKYKEGTVDEPLFIEDLRYETFIGDAVEMELIPVVIGGNETKIFIPKDKNLLRTRQQMIEDGLIKEGESLYVISANVYIGSLVSDAIDKTFDVYQMAESIKDAEYKALLTLCQETNEDNICNRTDKNGEWDTADESGAYSVEGCFKLEEVNLNFDGKDFVVFTTRPDECLPIHSHCYEVAVY